MANGVAFVATARSMLIFRFFDPDAGSVPPEIRSVQVGPDADPNTPGIQATAGSRIYISPDLVDDVQVRHVDLLINGQVVQSTLIAPFAFEWIAPAGPGTSTLQVRAADTGGNSRVSATVIVETR